MGVKEIDDVPVVEWIGSQLVLPIPVSHLEHNQVYFYRKCVFGPMTISVGDHILVCNANASNPESEAGCDIAKVLHLYELLDTTHKDPYRAIVQWYSRPRCIPSKLFDTDDLDFDFDCEIVEEHRPYDKDISIETIFSKCYVATGSPTDSARELLAQVKKPKNTPMFVCRYKFIKLKNTYKLVPLEYFEEGPSEDIAQRTRSARKSSTRKSTSSARSRESSVRKKQEVELIDVNSTNENKVSPIKIIGGNSVVKLSTKQMDISSREEAKYPSSPLTEKNHRHLPAEKAIAARRNLNSSLNIEADSTADTDILEYSIIDSNLNTSSQEIKIKLRLSESQKHTPSKNARHSALTLADDSDSVSSTKEKPTHRKRLGSDVAYIDIYNTPSKKTKNVECEATPIARRKSILKSGSTRVADGTPKRSIQLSNIVERRIYKDDDIVSTPKRRRSTNHLVEEPYISTDPLSKSSHYKNSTKATSPDATIMTPSRRLKLLRSGSLTPSINNRHTPKTDRRKSDLQIARESLHVSVVPKSLPCRETEFANIYTFLEGKIQDQCGGCMYVSGVPGTGKTATVTGVIRVLQKACADEKLPEFEFIEINGMRLTEPRQAYVQIYRQLTGKTVAWEQAQSLLEKRFTTPCPRRITTVLLVDELDILCNRRQDVVYNLLDWPTKSAARLVVITIANTMDLPERLLMGKVTSRLGLTRLTFQPYTHKQLQEIVATRLIGSESFKSDAVQLVARKVAAVSGDARRALDICRRATEIADAQLTEPKIVNMLHVQQALNEMISSAKVLAIKKCSKAEQIFLQAIVAEVNRTGVEETNFMGVYSQIESISAFMGKTAPPPGLALKICSRLGAARLIIGEHSRADIFQKILLNVSMDDIHYALKV